jgi:predicted RecB family nuclease
MQKLDDRIIFSASDITGFLACEHLTQLELRAAQGLITRPQRRDPLVDLLVKKGLEHENRFKASLQAQGLEVVEIPRLNGSLEALTEAARRTEEAMREGCDVIYQAVLFDGRWRGYADFLRRIELPSDLGDYGYEVWDTKLARKPKAAAVLQLCLYSDLVSRIQKVDPLEFHLVLGNQEIQSYRLRDYVAYFRMMRNEFVAATASSTDTYPDPVEHCRICRWRSGCNAQRRGDDHLSLVAEMRRDQIKKLATSGITTVEELAACDPTHRVKGIAPATFAKLQDQAAMQVEKRSTNEVAYKLLDPPGPAKGLEALPAPSRGDLYFDIEADPYAGPEGLEFLFGFVDGSGDEVTYEAWWAHDPTQEKAMFERFIDLVTQRLARFPDMHVYHYAPYEIGALRRLMGRHGTREEELDNLLRRQVFVDLYQVVRQSLRISEESYSIKRLEPFYMKKRDDRITEESTALVEYERYLETGNDRILGDLEEYNRYDCISLYYLQRWLERRRDELESVVGHELSRPTVEEAEASENLTAALQEVQACATALTQGLPEDERSPELHARWLLSELLRWHRREAKSEWWRYFDRHKETPEDLVDDSECLSGLNYEGVVGQVARSEIHKLTFPTQEHKIEPGGRYEDPNTRKGISVTEVNNDERYVLIKKLKGRSDHPAAIIPGKPIDTKVQRQALLRCAKQVVAAGIEGYGPGKAARDLLLRRPPDIKATVAGSSIRRPGEALEAAVRVGLTLKNSCLPIQGPPGTGKTYTGAHMIAALARAGRPVGIVATSHKVIANLLEAACEVAKGQGVAIKALQKCSEDDACVHDYVEIVEDNTSFDERFSTGEYNVVAGTSWLLCREELEGRLDTLFIDEAGQFSLADAVAVSGAAKNLVLLGDPQQLAQPSQGVHPPGTEVSVLGHVLAGDRTISDDRGLFLEKTWRMHPAVAAYVSEAFYEERLSAVDGCAQQDLDPVADLRGPGVYLVPLDHEGNRIEAPEEVAELWALMKTLIGKRWTKASGRRAAIGLDDMLVVAPYNAQVSLLRRCLPAGARVGTVDKFQGQEAAVTFYSMTTSHPEDIPRNFEFLYSHNRLNVALSRARTAAIVVCSPELLKARCKSPEQMRLINALCLFAERATRLPTSVVR